MFGRRHRLRVSGRSMEPALAEGDFVLVAPRVDPRPDDLVVADHPHQNGLLIIKRLVEISDDGGFVVHSDNPDHGTDSRTWGPLRPEAIQGTVTHIFGARRAAGDRSGR